MRVLASALIAMLLCSCGGKAHVRDKVYSILPPIEEEMGDQGTWHAFEPEILNPWVQALGTSKVVAQLEIALVEMPQYRRATLWMLKAYAPKETWDAVKVQYPDQAVALPDVAGYGEHPKQTEQAVEATADPPGS